MCVLRPPGVDLRGNAVIKVINYYVVLNDGETFSSLEGCTIVGISSNNKAANRALDEEDMEAAFEHADFISPIEVPAYASK